MNGETRKELQSMLDMLDMDEDEYIKKENEAIRKRGGRFLLSRDSYHAYMAGVLKAQLEHLLTGDGAGDGFAGMDCAIPSA